MAAVHRFAAQILDHRGRVLAGVVVVLAGIATGLAIAVTRDTSLLANEPSATPMATPTASPIPVASPATNGPIVVVPSSFTPRHSATPEPSVTPEPATPAPSAAAAPAPMTGWDVAARFTTPDGLTVVTDLAVWRDGFVAVGDAWLQGYMYNARDPLIWQSADGRSWTQATLQLGNDDAQAMAVAPLPDGGLLVMGTIGREQEHAADARPVRAAAWTSPDGVTWTEVAVPFGAAVTWRDIGYASGPEGFLATADAQIWHSVDGRTWRSVYEAPTGQIVYGPVAGDDGWIARIANPSLWETTFVVSGDAVTWHEVDFGRIGNVGSLGGDWIASRRSDDWQWIEVLRSSNGLDWESVLDPNTLTPPDGHKSNQGLGGFHGTSLSGTDDVAVISLWWQHCCAMPPMGIGIWWSTDDGTTWIDAGLGDDAYAEASATNGDVTVIAGYRERGGVATFWVSAP